MNWHNCDNCGCYLDPDKAVLCEECHPHKKKVIQNEEENTDETYDA